MLITKKAGFVPFLGKMVLLCFYTIGTAARVFCLLLFFTPSLGIFYTLFHYKLGLLVGSSHVFDIDIEGTVIYDNIWRSLMKPVLLLISESSNPGGNLTVRKTFSFLFLFGIS